MNLAVMAASGGSVNQMPGQMGSMNSEQVRDAPDQMSDGGFSCRSLICNFVAAFQGDSSLILEQLAEIDMLTQEGDTNSVRKRLLLLGLRWIDC